MNRILSALAAATAALTGLAAASLGAFLIAWGLGPLA